jgi:hypothetical protein
VQREERVGETRRDRCEARKYWCFDPGMFRWKRGRPQTPDRKGGVDARFLYVVERGDRCFRNCLEYDDVELVFNDALDTRQIFVVPRPDDTEVLLRIECS